DSLDEHEEVNAGQRAKAQEANQTNHSITTGVALANWSMPDMARFDTDTDATKVWWIEYYYNDPLYPSDYRSNFLRYETSIGESSDTGGSDNTDDYLRLLGSYEFSKDWFVSYEYEDFTSNITALEDSFYSNHNDETIRLEQGEQLDFETKFRDLHVGFIGERTKSSSMDYIVFVNDYRKPYTLIRQNQEVASTSDLLRNVTFRSFGLGFKATSINYNGFYGTFELYFGISSVKFNDDESFSDLIDKDQNVVYFNPRVKVGYAKSFFEQRVLLNASLYGDWKFYTAETNNQTTIGESDINRDIILKAYLSVQYLF
ncbi:MAG: hypothetical protein ACI8WB_006216, partial [Phenylobacterium sp.]